MYTLKQAFGLAGKTAVITGGGTGLGFAIAGCMAAAGARVILLGRREEVLKNACESIGENASWRRFDLMCMEEIPMLADSIIGQAGNVDILVNNAGIQYKKPAEEMTVEEYREVLDVHLTGSFVLTKAFLPHMRARKKGSVIFLASMCSFMGNPYLTGYASAKAGVLGLTRTFAGEASCDGVRFNAIAPGWIETPMFERALGKDPKRRERILERTPMKRFGIPEDIGWAAVYLASDASSFVTGASLVADGGALIGL